MSQEAPRNLAASIHRRLLTLAQKNGQDFGLVLTRYALERLLYRLSQSRHADVFVLKGAMLFHAWTAQAHRPTRDVDFLAHGEHSTARFMDIFRAILSQPVQDDGVIFLPETIEVETMKDDEDYPGLRVFAQVRLGKARISLQVDIGFGDAITPAPVVIEYPTLLSMPAPRLAVYPVETVVAEKFEAIVKLGIANSRMKDFFDIWVLARDFGFSGATLAAAIEATFERRKTSLPAGTPFAFTPEFHNDPIKKTQWQAFLKKNRLPGASFPDTIAALARFLMPAAVAVNSGDAFRQRWNPGGPWVGP